MQLTYVFSELGQGLRRNLSMHVAVVLTLFVSLTLVGLGVLLNQEAEKTEQRFGNLSQITVYFCNETSSSPNCNGDATPAQRKAILDVIDNNPEVASRYLESKQEAYEKVKELFSEEYVSRLPESFGPESLRDSVWIQLEDRDEFEGITSAVEGLDGVHSVTDTRKRVKPIYTIIDRLQWGAVATAVFLIFAALLLVANTIRLAAFARRREIGIMRLVGASTLYVSLPFLMEALVTALIGVLLAAVALAAFMQFAIVDGVQDEEFLQWMPWIGWPEYLQALLAVGVLGPLLTLVPTLLLARKYLKV